MQEAVKKLFDAPWAIEEEAPSAWYCVIDSKDSVVANDVRDQKTVNRISHLPELFDALLQATEDACRTCNHEKAEGILDRPCDDLHADECYVAEWRKLLRKVRDGE